MSTIKLISEQEAQGEVKEMFEQAKQMFGELPQSIQAMANHPEYMKIVAQKAQLFMNSQELDQNTKLIICLTVSIMNNCEMCISSYTKYLKNAGFTDKQIVEVISIIDFAGAMNQFNNAALLKP
ncbi:carboxymuconolactone decarboxylase family protein [Paenibacillus massiliensis]|uniref:carboxymuconolactone decarboxylase family protein n=1 Tax=Paenibacillus massiliensis TaxID=225917 RepID=UPI00041C9666|nr:carboxymuconolactone decarboxylase family protein [Paenibacillus massiliensis]